MARDPQVEREAHPIRERATPCSRGISDDPQVHELRVPTERKPLDTDATTPDDPIIDSAGPRTGMAMANALLVSPFDLGRTHVAASTIAMIPLAVALVVIVVPRLPGRWRAWKRRLCCELHREFAAELLKAGNEH